MKTQRAAVIGHPIGHTMSPFIQKRLFALSNTPMEYQVLDIPDLPAALPALRELDCFNITIPHKTAIIPFLDGMDESAALCGSVNTVKVSEGKLFGSTTDGPGAAVSLGLHGLDFHGKVLILGNGGAARAVAFQAAVEQRNFHITLVHREESYDKAMDLADSLAGFARKRGDRDFLVTVMSYRELEDDREGRWDLLVNTTSVGMYPHIDASPVSRAVAGRCAAVFDAVFNPGKTLLMEYAQAQGVQAVGGMGMLVCQAAYSHKVWYGTEFENRELLRLIDNAKAELARKFGGAL